jgi:hypothetical protein
MAATIYYMNTFNKGDMRRYFIIWKIVLKSRGRFEDTYKFMKKVYDPHEEFKPKQLFNLSHTYSRPDYEYSELSLVVDAQTVIRRIFDNWGIKEPPD